MEISKFSTALRKAFTVRQLLVRARPALVNTLIVLASLLSTYVAMEYAIFRVFLPKTPLDIHSRIPELADVLTQTTKSAYLPKDYVAILGDSYAEGLGDWLTQNGSKRNGPFHSANIIRQLTRRDVVSFGVRGAGSAEGIVLRPAGALPSSPCSVFPAIEPPRQMFIYFYEGNDIEDNIRFLDKVRARYGTSDDGAIDRYLGEDYAASSLLRCHRQLADMTFKLAEFLSQYYISGFSLTHCGTWVSTKNHLRIGESTIEAPALEGPAPHLDDDSIFAAMNVFARSLKWLRGRFPAVPITVIYVPSPLSVYRHAAEMVAFCSPTGGGPIGADVAARHHRIMRDLAARMSAAAHTDFVDATPVLRAAGETRVIHGPEDWDHLNKGGYEVLGKLVAARVQIEPEDLRLQTVGAARKDEINIRASWFETRQDAAHHEGQTSHQD